MSLRAFDTQGSLFGSLPSIATGLFADDDRYRLFAQKVWPVLASVRPQLAECYCADNGRPGIEPVVLLGVLVFQFLERVPDRQAMDLLKYHLGWKLALNLEIGAKSFHPTSLVVFRDRLAANEQGNVAFSAILKALQAEGLVPRKGKQRLDSTHVLGLVSKMSWLECVREATRLALEALDEVFPPSQRPIEWALWWERYVESTLDYKCDDQSFKLKIEQAGEDIWALLKWLEAKGSEAAEVRPVQVLRTVFEQRYRVAEDAKVQRIKPASGGITNPHEPEAKWSEKRKKEWIGYKVQVAETIGPDPTSSAEPMRNFITSIVTQDSIAGDPEGMKASLETQARDGLEAPQEMYVDSAYISGAVLAQAREEGRELLGPAQASVVRKGRDPAFRTESFDVDINARKAICPAGKPNTQCSRIDDKHTPKVFFRFEWSTHCHECPLRAQCVPHDQSHRTINVGEHHQETQARRREQDSEAFRQRMHERNAIEGTQSELIRGHGMRQSRYRGKNKTDLQNQFIGAACNVKRWLRYVGWQLRSAAASLAPTKLHRA